MKQVKTHYDTKKEGVQKMLDTLFIVNIIMLVDWDV